MNTMQVNLEEYLRLRRALGFKLVWPGHILPQFVTWLEDTGSETITTEAAITWARLSTATNPMTLSHRLGAVRGFARYLCTIDPATEVPPAGLFGKQRRITPYIYTPDEIGHLVQAARRLHPPLRAATHEALFGLLGATGASARHCTSNARTQTSSTGCFGSATPSSTATGWYPCTPPPRRRCAPTLSTGTGCVPGPAPTRSSSPREAAHWDTTRRVPRSASCSFRPDFPPLPARTPGLST